MRWNIRRPQFGSRMVQAVKGEDPQAFQKRRKRARSDDHEFRFFAKRAKAKLEFQNLGNPCATLATVAIQRRLLQLAFHLAARGEKHVRVLRTRHVESSCVTFADEPDPELATPARFGRRMSSLPQLCVPYKYDSVSRPSFSKSASAATISDSRLSPLLR